MQFTIVRSVAGMELYCSSSRIAIDGDRGSGYFHHRMAAIDTTPERSCKTPSQL